MDQHNRRQSTRIECDLPVRLGDGNDACIGRIIDMSRTGMRVRIAGALLGVHRLSSLVHVTRQLQHALGETFSGSLHYEMLGPLVNRVLTPSRIAKRDWEQTDVEIGCQFDSPLSDDEITMMGLAVPAVGADGAPEADGQASPVHRIPANHASSRPHLNRPALPDYKTYVYPEPGKLSKPLVTWTRVLTRGMAMLEVQAGQGWDRPDVGVGDLVMALDAAYGTDILLRVVDEEQDLWAGPGEVLEVDVHPDTRRLKLGVSFGRELRSEELGRLGLPTPA